MKTNPSHDVIFIAPLVCCLRLAFGARYIYSLFDTANISKIIDISKFFVNYFSGLLNLLW